MTARLREPSASNESRSFQTDDASYREHFTPAAGIETSPTFRKWYWLTLPALAVIAYATVLRIGFLADDLLFLEANKQGIMDTRVLLPQQDSFFYRPVGLILTWIFGYSAYGLNPVPYHLQGLALHAAVSLVVGLWLREVSNKALLGWLAGALFAVFPAHLEAVGWVAAQWDLQATLFGLLSAWLFTVWWKRRSRHSRYLLLASVLLYALGFLLKKVSLPSFL